ncbi:MAG TPA: PilZ domain-containing protein [Anaerolineaceae bacterium]|nr:PilZ domain-containing protein [Anaerolineaceae bacterium]
MSAEFVDALIGYEYFLQNRGKVTRIQINDYLIKNQHREIQQRTYIHYKKLIENGFRSYIPINKFDVFQSLGKIQMAADRRRYSRDATELPVKISRNGISWVDGTIVDRSLVGFGIVTRVIFPLSKNSQIWVRLENYEDIPAIIVWRQHQEDSTKLGVRALEFIGKYKIADSIHESARLSGVFFISRSIEGNIRWENLYRVLSKSDEFLNAIADLIYSVSDLVSSDIRLASPILESINFGSPGEVQIKVDFGIAELAKLFIEKLQYWSLDKRKYLAEVRKTEIENKKATLENKKLAFENSNLRIDLLRNAINLSKETQDKTLAPLLLGEVKKQLSSIFNIKQLPSDAFETDSLELAILMKRVLPAGAELTGGDDPDFIVGASTEGSPLNNS